MSEEIKEEEIRNLSIKTVLTFYAMSEDGDVADDTNASFGEPIEVKGSVTTEKKVDDAKDFDAMIDRIEEESSVAIELVGGGDDEDGNTTMVFEIIDYDVATITDARSLANRVHSKIIDWYQISQAI